MLEGGLGTESGPVLGCPGGDGRNTDGRDWRTGQFAYLRGTVRWLRAVNGMLCSPCGLRMLRHVLLARRKVDGVVCSAWAGALRVLVADGPLPPTHGGAELDVSFRLSFGLTLANTPLPTAAWHVYWRRATLLEAVWSLRRTMQWREVRTSSLGSIAVAGRRASWTEEQALENRHLPAMGGMQAPMGRRAISASSTTPASSFEDESCILPYLRERESSFRA